MNQKVLLGNIERENKFIKNLFKITKFQEKNSTNQITKFLAFLQNSKNVPKYFIKLIGHYSLCRPKYPNISKLFVKCIFSCFPEQNKNVIMNQTDILKFIIFPEDALKNQTEKFQQKTKTPQINEEFQ